MNQFLDLKNIFSLAHDLRYCAIKVDAPGFTKNFPNEYPIGRDVDLICHDDDFQKFIDICHNNISHPHDHTKHVIADSHTQKRFRVHAPSYFLRPNPRPSDKLIQGQPWTQLHFQIDITSTKDKCYIALNDDFIDSLFEDAQYLNCVKVLNVEKESTFRLLSYEKI